MATELALHCAQGGLERIARNYCVLLHHCSRSAVVLNVASDIA